MIKLENYDVLGWEHAIRGMRNPMNSWAKSDSYSECPDEGIDCQRGWMHLGPNDHALMEKLVKGGPVHAKFRRMITVYVDITAPLYWWKEFDTYKVGTVANSCSTMHKIHEKEFTMDDFSCEHLNVYELVGINGYEGEDGLTPMTLMQMTVDMLNYYRRCFIEDGKNKDDWWQMIQLLPSSYNQKRTVMLNYEVLANIYEWRKNHKLDEWRSFCEWIEQLPYSEIITEQREPEHNPLAHPERYVSDTIAMIGDMTEAQRVEVMKCLKVKTPEECPYWNYKKHESLGTCNGCEVEDLGIIINGDRYCNIISPTKEEE